MLIISDFTQASDSQTLFIWWGGNGDYGKCRFMLHTVDMSFYKVQSGIHY